MSKLKIVLLFCIAAFMPFLPLLAGGSGEAFPEDYRGVERIVVSLPDWDSEISTTKSSGEVALEMSGYDSSRYDIEVTQQRGTLSIRIEKRRTLNIFNSDDPLLSLDIPSNIDIEISSASGDIDINGSLTGELSLKTASGDITADTLQGTIEIKSASGNIDLDRIQGSLRADLASGSIRIDEAEGLLSLKTASGTIEIASSLASIEARTASGDIRLYNAEIFDAARFATASGDISIQLIGDIDVFSFDARTTSGKLRIFNREAERQILAGSGEVRIEIATSSGDIRVY